MIKREAENTLKDLATQFKAVAVIGPRQSGKTTLVRTLFKNKPYVNLENTDSRDFALNDPKGFLAQYKDGAIFDEIQRTPELFSYLQQILDEDNKPGKFILTGSNNFLLQENISQSLAGRIAYLNLLPFSISELSSDEISDHLNLMFKGFYPPIYDQPVKPDNWYINYIQTYIEKDVRQIKNITNLLLFGRFLRLCAGRTGQLLNMNSLAIETGVDNKTIASWISILESSFIIFRLYPHYKNFNKRIVKMPKIYFYDTGLACSLLGIRNKEQLALNPYTGSLFENLIVSEIFKYNFNHYHQPNIFFWRDNTGHEIDIIIEIDNSLYPVEIKSGQTITTEYYKGLLYWNKISETKTGTVIYAGNSSQEGSNNINIIPYLKLPELMNKLVGNQSSGR